MPTKVEKRRRRRERRRVKRDRAQALRRLGITGRVLVANFRDGQVEGTVDLGDAKAITVWGLRVHEDFLAAEGRTPRR